VHIIPTPNIQMKNPLVGPVALFLELDRARCDGALLIGSIHPAVVRAASDHREADRD